MGTIAQKLEYLNDTRLLLKDNINKINNVLDDNSTFRSYPQELFNGYLDILNNGTDTLWNNLEKVSQTGTEAVLEGVETAPIKMVLNGNTSQDTTTGRNKLPTNKSDWESGHYDTYGNKSAFATRMRTIDLIPFLPNTTYSVLGTDFYIREYDSNGTFINNLGSVYNGGTFTTNSNTAYLGISINITYSDYVENINQIAIFLNSETNKTWEPYTGGQPSPSSDYPQEVKVVKGENVVSVSGKNLLPISSNVTQYGITSVKNEDGSISFSGIATSTYCYITNRTPVELPIGYYAFSINKAVNYGVRLQLEFEDGTTGNVLTIATGRTSVGGTTSKIVKAIRIYLISLTSGTEYNDTLYLQLEKGSTATPYVPYSKTDYPLSLGTIELCKIRDYKDYLFKRNGKWYVHKAIGKKVVTSSEILAQADSYSNVIYYKFNKNTDSINYNNYNSMVAFYTHAKISNNFIFDSLSQVSTINSLAENIRYWVGFPKGTTLAQAKEKLVGSVLYYILKTPTEEEITNTTLIEQLEEISKAKSVKDKTYITQTNDDLPFILDVEAIKEYEVN